MGTIDIIAPGGTSGYLGTMPVVYGYGLPAAPSDSLDTNGQYLGIGASPTEGGSEYALWGTSFTVTEATTFQFKYYWAAAGGSLPDGTDILPTSGLGMGAEFFILNGTTDYSAGAPEFAQSSTLYDYAGAGNQVWYTELGTFTLDPGEYYWGFSATGNGESSYIVVEGISITPVPEPSGALFAMLGAITFCMSRRRVSKA